MKSDDWPVPIRIRQLVHRCFDEPITGEEALEIQQALADNPAARAWYAELAQLHADLAAHQQSLEVCNEIQLEFGSSQTAGSSLGDSERPSRRQPRPIASLIRKFPFGVAASLLVIGLGLGCCVGLFAASLVHIAPRFVATPWNWKVGNDVVARIATTDNVRWKSSESPETLPTQGLREGQRIRLAEGKLQLRYRSGVQLILSGPAVYEIRSENGGKLYEGRLSAVSPLSAGNFHIQTDTGRLQLGTGHYGVEVVQPANGEAPETIVHVFSSVMDNAVHAQFIDSSGQRRDLVAGDAVNYSHSRPPRQVALASYDDFPQQLLSPPPTKYRKDVVYLGNLFDDSKTASLEEAIATDTFQAAAETVDLGIATVHDGGLDVDVSLAEDGLRFNFANVGGGGAKVRGLPSNDTYRSVSPVPIRTTGEDFGGPGPERRVEEGFGMSANELLTFDLKELRNAGKLGSIPMRLVVDRAGINDREDPVLKSREGAAVHTVVLVSSVDKILSAHVNGEPFKVVDRGGVYSVDLAGRKLTSLRYDGKFVTFDVEIPPEARYLTFATTMIDNEHHDHAVFSGARLELVEE